MNIEEAMEAAILGEKVTHDGLGRDTFVSYDFGKDTGFKQKHMKHFGEWASCTFSAGDFDMQADWRIETRDHCGTCFAFVKFDAFGKHCACSRNAAHVESEAKRFTATMGGAGGGKTDKIALNRQFGKLTLDPSKQIHIDAPPKPSAWAGVAVPAPKRDTWGRPID